MRLLIATGGSPHSDAAVSLAAYILQQQDTGDTPTLVTVINHERKYQQAKKILARACQLLDSTGIEAQTKIRVGRPAEEIICESEEGQYDLVIVGERATHGLVTRFLNSIAVQVAEQAPCPAIIAKGQVGPIHRILLCDSGATEPSLIMRVKDQLPYLTEGETDITILHVMSQISAGPGVKGTQLRSNTQELIQEHTPEGTLLAQDARILEAPSIHPFPKVRHGLVVDEILGETHTGNYDLVVIGAHRSQGWQHFLLDNLAHQIIVKVNRPILVVK